jgi:hypothetical protein
VVLAEIYRRTGEWKIRNVGQGYASGLAGLASDYGIVVAEPPPPPAPASPPASLAPEAVARWGPTQPGPGEVARREPTPDKVATVGFFERRRAEKAQRAAGRDAFEDLAMRAAVGDPDAVRALPRAVSAARVHYSTRQFEQKRLEALTAAVRSVIDDDVLTRAEEQHVDRLLSALELPMDVLQQRAYSLWEAMIVARVNDGRPPVVRGSGHVILRRGEIAHIDLAASLMKEQVIREYRGRSSGVSVPIGFGMRYRTGSSRGRSVVIGTELVAADSGRLLVTNRRVSFIGQRKTLEFRYDRMAALEEFRDGLRLSVSNRQAASLFKLPRGSSPVIASAVIALYVAHAG